MIITPVILFHTAPIEQAKVENEESTKFVLTKEENVISVVRNRISINPGDSRYTLDLERERIRRDREILARETRGQSYTGTGTSIEVIGYSSENCVQYAKRITGITGTLGGGGRAKIQGQTPKVGAIGVEKKRVHAVVIEKIEGEEVTVTEANFYNGRITRRRLRLSDFMGFVYS